MILPPPHRADVAANLNFIIFLLYPKLGGKLAGISIAHNASSRGGRDTDDSSGDSRTGVPRGHGHLVGAASKVVLPRLHDNGATNDGVRSCEGKGVEEGTTEDGVSHRFGRANKNANTNTNTNKT